MPAYVFGAPSFANEAAGFNMGGNDPYSGRQYDGGISTNPATRPAVSNVPAPGTGQVTMAPTGSVAAVADPFAGQRAQYQSMLSQIMGSVGNNQTTQDIANMRQLAASPAATGGPYAGILQNLMTNPNSITMTPGSQFQIQQGQDALSRSAAAKGELGSGNILLELQQQAQGMAATDYNNQITQAINAMNATEEGAKTQFGMAQGVAGAQAGLQGQNINELLTASGANSGSPSAAAEIMAQQMNRANSGSGIIGASPGTNPDPWGNAAAMNAPQPAAQPAPTMSGSIGPTYQDPSYGFMAPQTPDPYGNASFDQSMNNSTGSFMQDLFSGSGDASMGY